MAAPYTSQTIASYNANPPPDDGSASAANEIDWSKVKTKIGDPVKTLSENINSQLVTAFAKVVGGAGVVTSATDYTVQSADQGKLVRMTGGTTLTTPDAGVVTSPFVFAFVNDSGSAITFDGSGAQTVNGSASQTVPAGSGGMCYTDGTNWFTTGNQGTLVGKQLMYGDIINGTLVAASDGASGVTFSLKTLLGADPSASDPVLICFRNSTAATGNYVFRSVVAALSLTVPSGATLGFTSAVASRIWVVLFDDGGTVRLGVINCRSGANVYPLGQAALVSSTILNTSSDSAQVFYTAAAVTTKAYVILAYCNYEGASVLGTAGNYSALPLTIQLYSTGVPLPGQRVQSAISQTGAVANSATILPFDDTIPAITEGNEYMTQAITPMSAANILSIRHYGYYAAAAADDITAALFQDATSPALAAGWSMVANTSYLCNIALSYRMVAGTTSSTTFRIRSGSAGGASTTFNGVASARKLGGVANSTLEVEEIMA